MMSSSAATEGPSAPERVEGEDTKPEAGGAEEEGKAPESSDTTEHEQQTLAKLESSISPRQPGVDAAGGIEESERSPVQTRNLTHTTTSSSDVTEGTGPDGGADNRDKVGRLKDILSGTKPVDGGADGTNEDRGGRPSGGGNGSGVSSSERKDHGGRPVRNEFIPPNVKLAWGFADPLPDTSLLPPLAYPDDPDVRVLTERELCTYVYPLLMRAWRPKFDDEGRLRSLFKVFVSKDEKRHYRWKKAVRDLMRQHKYELQGIYGHGKYSLTFHVHQEPESDVPPSRFTTNDLHIAYFAERAYENSYKPGFYNPVKILVRAGPVSRDNRSTSLARDRPDSETRWSEVKLLAKLKERATKRAAEAEAEAETTTPPQ